MPDTQRTKSSLATLLADNTSGDISAQDQRDFLETMDGAYGHIWFSSETGTTPAGAGTALKALGTTTSQTLKNFTMPSNNRLTYTGDPTVPVFVRFFGYYSVATAADICTVRIAKNDSVLSPQVFSEPSGNAILTPIQIEASTTLDTDDYVELWLTNEDGTNAVTVGGTLSAVTFMG